MTELAVAEPDASEVNDAAPTRPRVRRVTAASVGVPLLTGIVALALWELTHRLELIPNVILPSPVSVAEEMGILIVTDYFWSNLWVTLQEALIGFTLGSIIGFVLGVGVGMSRWISRALYPYIVLVQAMPRVALAPVFVALLGFGMGAKVLTALVICFFPVFINTLIGLQETDEDALSLMRSLCATKSQIFRKLQLPGSLPMIFGGLKTAMTLALVGAIVGELSAANAGIALLIEAAAFQLRMDAVFAAILWLSIVAVVLFGIMELLDRKIVFWKEHARKGRFEQE